MIEVSLFGFLVSGAFLGFANFDLFYQLVAMVIILNVIYEKEMQPALPIHSPQTESVEVMGDTLLAQGVTE